MPGFELIGKEEQLAVQKVFEEGGILFAHGFDALRKKYHVREFESRISDSFHSEFNVAVSSGTAGLKCALKAIGVNHQDEVITQAFNFVGTIEAIIDCGAKPIICSIDENLHLNIEDLKKKITKKTKAIIIVHMLGFGGPIKEILSIGNEFKIPIVEDNCEAIGATYNNESLGAIGDIGVMSFDHGKMIACGEGGMVLTNNKNFGKYLSQYIDHGHENNPTLPRGKDNRIMPGFNYRMTELQAAVGKVQLSKLNFMLNENKKRFMILNNVIKKKFNVRKELDGHIGSYDTFIFSVKDQKVKEKVLNILKEFKFGTKNLPDAMEWHCSYFWNHALSKENILNSFESYKILLDQIAIPILLKRSLEDYKNLSSKIINL